MFADAAIGSKVALYYYGEIVGEATIEDQTACYWKLSNGQRFQKELGYYFESYNKSKCIKVRLWTSEVEAVYQAYQDKKRIASALSAQKSKLDEYIQYMKTGYFGKLSSDQIAAILLACQDQIGDISTQRIR